MHTALSIAGTDPTGGAGMQADIKTFTALHVYGMGVVTTVVAQNTCGVYAVQNMHADMVKAQLDAVFTDIFPDAVKIGMVSTIPVIGAIIQKLKEYNPKNIVLDPVMVATSGQSLLEPEAEQFLIERLIPLSDIITPNIPEAEVLCGFPIKSMADMLRAAEHIAEFYGGTILIKGGHLGGSNDLLFRAGNTSWVTGKHINTNNTHGTGCTLSSAIAAGLAKGYDAYASVRFAKDYVTRALDSGLDLGKGNGPVDHCHCIPEIPVCINGSDPGSISQSPV